jgi:hypothetical protein
MKSMESMESMESSLPVMRRHALDRRCVPRLAGVILAAATLGCSYLPPPLPVIPGEGGNFGAGVTVGRMYAPTTAVVRSPSTGEVVLRQGWDTEMSSGVPAIFDPRLHASVALGDRLYLGGHLSWLTVGAAVHHVPVRPVVLTLGLQTDGPLAYAAAKMPGVAWETEASVLVQPTVAGRVQLLVGGGVSYGPRRRSLVATAPVGVVGIDQVLPAEVRVLRGELRADLLGGLAVRLGAHGRVLLAAQPFFVLGQPGAPRAECLDCVPDLALVSYASSWGMAFTASFSGWN